MGLAPPPRPSAAGGTPPSSWRLGALLSSDEFRVERRAGGLRSSVMASEYAAGSCMGRSSLELGVVSEFVL
jgi:hypothetical protein